ncbi:MAG: copper chaperone PCu(A)C [Acidimicrobiales bacterium]
MMLRRAPLALGAVLIGLSCASDGSGKEAIGVMVRDPWIRTPPPFANTAALYTLIENVSSAPDSLIAIESPSCESFALHRTVTESGVASMTAIDEGGLPVGSGETLVLEPLGLHGMCLGLSDSLTDGDQVEVELVFASAGRVALIVPVERR